ncbi:helix-turn-helix domain-containing protein [Rhodococcus cerastii]|uniref:Helix-turn-helix domain-containing protein n=1 Tax=Rhodococcus cerastii TaxID=908616 RepID=A0ABU4D753_9NOCA|nr:helix-turn-helix domain-containing protein [Rhodococcus cerastii]MDV6305563.1 helix-turn-helix domain-containing protein [Rhodococcus cerastii]
MGPTEENVFMLSQERTYTEFPSPVEGIRCSWQRRSHAGDRPLIVPDGCVDLIWFSDGRLEVAGPDTAARRAVTIAPVEMVGVRLAPAVARRVSAIPIGELCDQQPHVAELGASLMEVAHALTGHDANGAMPARRKLLADLTVRAMKPAGDGLVLAAVRVLEARPGMKVVDLADGLGVGVRQLHRKFVDEVGYGPKILARVMRVGRLVDVAATVPDLASLSYVAGFASQAHMSDEVRALTTLTPVRFLEERRGPSYVGSLL